MLSQFRASYQRVDQSLQRLAESVAAYNPPASAADELVAADEAVNQNLEQCRELLNVLTKSCTDLSQ